MCGCDCEVGVAFVDFRTDDISARWGKFGCLLAYMKESRLKWGNFCSFPAINNFIYVLSSGSEALREFIRTVSSHKLSGR